MNPMNTNILIAERSPTTFTSIYSKSSSFNTKHHTHTHMHIHIQLCMSRHFGSFYSLVILIVCKVKALRLLIFNFITILRKLINFPALILFKCYITTICHFMCLSMCVRSIKLYFMRTVCKMWHCLTFFLFIVCVCAVFWFCYSVRH